MYGLLMALGVFGSKSAQAQFTFGYPVPQPPATHPANSVTQLGGPYFELVPYAQNKRGSIWSTTQWNLNESFDFTFFMNFGSNDEDGADGIVFVMHSKTQNPNNVATLGDVGGKLGYAKGYIPYGFIDTSLAIEFDTYYNDPFATNYDLYRNPVVGPVAAPIDEIDHIDLFWNGDNYITTASRIIPDPIQAHPSNRNIEDGNCHRVRVKWTAADTLLEIFFDDMNTPRVSYHRDIRKRFSYGMRTPYVWWGLTSATGNKSNPHYFTYIDAGAEQRICRGNSATIGSDLAQATGLVYRWDSDQSGSYTSDPTRIVSPTTTGWYKVYMKGTFNNVAYCEVYDSVRIKVNWIEVNAGNDATIVCGQSTQLNATTTQETNGDAQDLVYTWYPATDLSSASVRNPVADPRGTTEYRVIVSNPITGCSDTDYVTVVVTSFDVTINNDNDPSITCGQGVQLSVTLDPPQTNPLFEWIPSAGLDYPNLGTTMAHPTQTTMYVVKVTNPSTGCFAYDTVIVNYIPFTVDLGPDRTVNCNTYPYVFAAVSPEEGTYTYSWASDPPGLVNDVNSSGIAVDPPKTSDIIVTVTNEFGCTLTDRITIRRPTFTADAGLDITSECGAPVNLNVNVTQDDFFTPNALSNLSYLWIGENGFTSNLASPTVNPTTTTTYTIRVTNPVTGCFFIDEITVFVPELKVDLGSDIAICPGNSATLNADVSNASSVSYLWSPPVNLNCTTCSTVIATPPGPQTYTVQVTNAYGCTASDEIKVTVNGIEITGRSFTIAKGESVKLEYQAVTVPVGTITYSWSTNYKMDCLGDPDCKNPEVSPEITTTYVLTVTTNPGGCTDTAIFTVTVLDCGAKSFEKLYGQTKIGNYRFGEQVFDLLRTQDSECGEFLMTGASRNPSNPLENALCLVKTDASGSREWSGRYTYAYYDEGCAVASSEGRSSVNYVYNSNSNQIKGYAVLGNVAVRIKHYDIIIEGATPVYYNDVIVMITDLNGNPLVSKAFGHNFRDDNSNEKKNSHDNGYKLINTSDKGLIVVGSTFRGGKTVDIYVVKISNNLALQWAKVYSTEDKEAAYDILEISDGYIMTASAKNEFAYAIKIDKNGNVKWNKRYSVPNAKISGLRIVEKSKPNSLPEYIIGGTITYASGASDAYLLDIDRHGNVLWSKGIGTANPNQIETFGSLQVNSNNNITLAFNYIPGGITPGLITLSPAGDILGVGNIYGSGIEHNDSGNVVALPDGSMVFAATAHGYGEPRGDYYLVKTDKNGINGCSSRHLTLVSNTLTTHQDSIYLHPSVFQQSRSLSSARTDTPTHKILCENFSSACEDAPGGSNKTMHGDFGLTPNCGIGTFESDLIPGCNNLSSFNPMNYAIVSDASSISSAWQANDHSMNGSDIFVADGPPSDLRAWYQSILLDSGRTYLFCIWAKNVCEHCLIPSQIELRAGGINGDLISLPVMLHFQEGWINITGTYQPQTSGFQEIDVIVKGNPHLSNGNDFALDDISFYDITPGSILTPEVLSENNVTIHEDELFLYPNPVKAGGLVNISYVASRKGIVKFEIVDALGRKAGIFSHSSNIGKNQAAFSTARLSPGMYLLTGAMVDKVIEKAFVIVR